MRKLGKLFTTFIALSLGVGTLVGLEKGFFYEANAADEKTFTATQSSSSAANLTGDYPTGASITFSNNYKDNKQQLTADHSMVYTISGLSGCTIKSVTLSMHSNTSKGKGSLSLVAGSTTIFSIADSKFNTANWYGQWSTEFKNVTKSISSSYKINEEENLILTISASENSLFCQHVAFTYTDDSDPEPVDDEIKDVSNIEDGAYYYIKGVRSNTAYKLSFPDAVGATQKGTEANDSDKLPVLLQFNAVSGKTNTYYLVSPNGNYVSAGASNGTINVSSDPVEVVASNQTGNKIRLKTGDWSIQKNNSAANFGGYKDTQSNITLIVGSSIPTTDHITIKTEPKTEYNEGEYFDPTGLEITKYSTPDDTTGEDIPYLDNESKFSFDPELDHILTSSDDTVTITFDGKSTDLEISVAEKTKATITYDRNETPAATKTQSVYIGVPATLEEEQFTNPNYKTFDYWCRSKSGTNVDSEKLHPGNSITVTSADGLTLYAIWKLETYTLQYIVTPGTGGPEDQTGTHEDDIVVADFEGTAPDDKIFAGWYKTKDCLEGDEVPVGSVVHLSNSFNKLYAKWDDITVLSIDDVSKFPNEVPQNSQIDVNDVDLEVTLSTYDKDTRHPTSIVCDTSTVGSADATFYYGNLHVTKTVNIYEVPMIDLTTLNDIVGTPTTEEICWSRSNVTITATKGSGTSNAVNSYYPGTEGQNYKSTRFYKNNSLTFNMENGVKIKQIIYKATTETYASNMISSTWTNATVAISTTDNCSVIITPSSNVSSFSAVMSNTTGGTEFAFEYVDKIDLSLNLTNITADTTSGKIYPNTEIVIQFSPVIGYSLPLDVIVKIGLTTLTIDEDYLYGDGLLMIDADLVESNVSITASGVIETYDILYEMNGHGECPEDNIDHYTYEDETFVLLNPINVTGYVFVRWYVLDENDHEVTIEEITHNSYGDLIIYAEWSSTADTYNVFYDANGGVYGDNPAYDNTDYSLGSVVTVIDPGTISKDGFSFVCWNTESDGSGDSYYTVAPNNKFTITKDTTLYAVWEFSSAGKIDSLTTLMSLGYTYLNNPPQTFNFVRFKGNIADLNDGEEAVIISKEGKEENSKYYALSHKSDTIGGLTVDKNDNTFDSDVVWTINKSDDNAFSLSYKSAKTHYLKPADSGTGISLADSMSTANLKLWIKNNEDPNINPIIGVQTKENESQSTKRIVMTQSSTFKNYAVSNLGANNYSSDVYLMVKRKSTEQYYSDDHFKFKAGVADFCSFVDTYNSEHSSNPIADYGITYSINDGEAKEISFVNNSDRVYHDSYNVDYVVLDLGAAFTINEGDRLDDVITIAVYIKLEDGFEYYVTDESRQSHYSIYSYAEKYKDGNEKLNTLYNDIRDYLGLDDNQAE